MLHFYVFLLVQLFACKAQNQPNPTPPPRPKPVIRTDYFRSPVDHPIKLAGTFCELRPNHFHTGIDIKSATGAQGDNIYAVADGYVSRIGISPTGYGNALYIDHPNGFTSVYGHLQGYSPEITQYALEEQTRQQRFDIQYYPDSTLIRIKKGQIIGKMGNTGSSNGAHLHFEIRETVTEEPINPLFFGLLSADKQAPGISYARIYDLDQNMDEFNARNLMARKRGSIFVPAPGDTIFTLSPQIGLGINTRDGQEENWNKNGVYSIKLFLNDSLLYFIQMDSVSFDKTRMINAHIDYPEQRRKRNYVHKCFTLPGNLLQIIKYQQKRGIIDLRENEKKKVRFVVTDFNKNTSVMEFYVKRKPGAALFPLPEHNYFFAYNKTNIVSDTGLQVNFTERTFFKNQYLKISKKDALPGKTFSKIFEIGNPDIPVYDYYTCKILADSIPPTLRQKAYIAGIDANGEWSNWGGTWEGDWLVAPVRAFGSFAIAIDSLPPRLTPIIFSKNLTRTSKIVFKIDDNVVPTGQTPYLNYRTYIDDIYIPMQYDLKTKTIKYVFPPKFPKGKHTFRLEVFDALNNTKVYTSAFLK